MEEPAANRDDMLRHLLKLFQGMADQVWDKCRPKGEPDPAKWDTAKANAVVSNLMTGTEQLYLLCLAMRANFPTTFEMTHSTLAFLEFLGVPKTFIAERAELSRTTIYSKLEELQKTFENLLPTATPIAAKL
jgi:hypothetical protein